MSKLLKDLTISLTVSVEDAISNYFAAAQNTIKRYGKYLERHRELDFLKMRRFLHTTYKTLHEIDPTFMAHQLINIWKQLETVADVYDDFRAKDKLGGHSFEMIFLRFQDNFKSYEGRMEHNADEITYLRQLAEKFKENVDEYKKRLASVSKNSDEYTKFEYELKRLKTRENNAIVRLGELVEENAIISKALTEFKKSYEDQFVKEFSKFVHNVRPSLVSVLNSMAFEFDIDLWHKAKESQVIQSYFQNANAGSVVSSKTYLKYFLKNLDENKLSKANQELRDLLNYLNEQTGVCVLIFLPDDDDMQRFQHALEADSSSYEIFSAQDAKSALTVLLSESIDILILDADVEERTLVQLIETYADRQPKKREKTKIILTAGEIDDARIAQAKKIRVNSLIEREIEPIEIIDTVHGLM